MASIPRKCALAWILASACFWMAWYLMPDPGTTNGRHILQMVALHRLPVLISVIIQILSSLLYIAAILWSLQASGIRREIIPAAGLFLIGAMGICADAFFHLLAYCMTNPGVSMHSSLVRCMELMQSFGLVFLVPLLLPFFAGSFMMARGFKRLRLTSRRPSLLIGTGIVLLLIGMPACRFMFPELSREVSLSALALLASGQAFFGIEPMARRSDSL